MTRFILGVLAYAVPTFALGFVWHLILFESYYAALRIYRSDIIIPFGMFSMIIQGVVFAWMYRVGFAERKDPFAWRVVTYGALAAVLSWSFTTLAVAAKNLMASVPAYLVIETAFTLIQWTMVAPLMALAFAMPRARPALRAP